MNSEKVIEELKQPFDQRLKFRTIYVCNREELEILNDALRDEWVISRADPDYKGGVFYTLKRGG